jgi:ribose 5-phosphate isomerase A
LSYDDAISALSTDALKFVKDGYVLGLGSGRAATAFVNSLSDYLREHDLHVRAVPTSLQIKLIAEQGGIHLIEADQIENIDVVFDGADQIDHQKYLIKGGGGALLRENILINAAKKVVIMADKSKFVKNFNRAVPVEVHPLARNTVTKSIHEVIHSLQKMEM